jgi:hypothetical protein
MWCPYCGYEMRQGFVRLRGQWASWAGVLAVNFEAGDDSGEGSELLPRTLFRSHERAAHCCVRCEAVLVEPKSAPYVAPADDASPAERAEATAPAGPAGETEADGPAAAEAPSPTEGSRTSAGGGNGNGDGPAPTT